MYFRSHLIYLLNFDFQSNFSQVADILNSFLMNVDRNSSKGKYTNIGYSVNQQGQMKTFFFIFFIV